MNNPIVTIQVESLEPMVLELDPVSAPNTVANFISIAKSGAYTGSIFHRVIESFMIQGGQVAQNLRPIKGEFIKNGVNNPIKHVRGVISMARTMDPNSATSQFFIMHQAAPHLDGSYAAFGKLLSGEATLDLIATTPTARGDRPIKDMVIQSITVDTFGEIYPNPVRI